MGDVQAQEDRTAQALAIARVGRLQTGGPINAVLTGTRHTAPVRSRSWTSTSPERRVGIWTWQRRARWVFVVVVLGVVSLASSAAAASQCPEANPSYDGPCGPLFTTPQWSDQSSWSAPSAYETIGLVRLGRRSAKDLIGRDSTGLWVEQFDAHAGQWRLLGSSEGGVALALSDRDGWNRRGQYTTIQTADLNGDGDYELLARAADGVHVYRWNPGTDTFTDISKAPRLFSDAAGGNDPSVYETIQTADLLGDGHAEILGRTSAGIEYARWNEHSGQFEDVTQTGIAPDAHGGKNPSVYKTIQAADLNGDGKAELMVLADGLRWYVRQADGRFHEQQILPLTDQYGWGRPSQYETIRAVRFPGLDREVVLARDRIGLRVYWILDNRWRSKTAILDDLQDGFGFESPSQYRTIQAGDVTGSRSFDIVARTSTGITTWQLRQTGRAAANG